MKDAQHKRRFSLMRGLVLLFLVLSASATAAKVTVTLINNSASVLRRESASHSEFPEKMLPNTSVTFVLHMPLSRSDILLRYSKQSENGGCVFSVSHKEYASGPKYQQEKRALGSMMDAQCSLFLSEKWSKPYNYKVKFTVL